MTDHEIGDGRVFVQPKDRQSDGNLRIRRERDDMGISGKQPGRTGCHEMHLDLRNRGVPESLHQHDVAIRQLRDRCSQIGRWTGCHQDFQCTRFAVPPGIFSAFVHIDAVMGVLDHGHPQPAPAEQRNQVLDQRGFAVSRIRGEADGFQVDALTMRALQGEKSG